MRPVALTILTLLLASGARAANAPTPAQVQPVGMVDAPCTPEMSVRRSPSSSEILLKPGPLPPAVIAFIGSPASQATGAKARSVWAARDWPGLCQYRRENDGIVASGQFPTAVLIGDSITEYWAMADPSLFGPALAGRGISSEVSGQLLARFRQDVIALKPKVVHFLVGTNDIAGNFGPSRPADYQANIMSMCEIARANGVRVVLGSILPARRMLWSPDIDPRARIAALNAWLKAYAVANGIAFVDYHAALAGPDDGMKPELSNDGVHPNRNGYAVMRPLLEAALAGR